MKHQPFTLLFALMIMAQLMVSSCRTHGPAFSANADPYMAKPAYRGENQGAFYLSGRLNQGYEYYAGEENTSGELAAHASYMSKNFYSSGGIYGYWGNYDVNGLVSPVTGGGDQPFNGGGIRGELGGRVPLKSYFDLLVGINAEMFVEGGKYADNSSDAFSTFFTLGFNRLHFNAAPAMDLRFTPPGKWDIGVRYTFDSYISVTDIINEGSRSYLHRLTLHSTIEPVTLFGQIGFAPDKQQVLSLGLSYGIPFKKKGVTE